MKNYKELVSKLEAKTTIANHIESEIESTIHPYEWCDRVDENNNPVMREDGTIDKEYRYNMNHVLTEREKAIIDIYEGLLEYLLK